MAVGVNIFRNVLQIFKCIILLNLNLIYVFKMDNNPQKILQIDKSGDNSKLNLVHVGTWKYTIYSIIITIDLINSLYKCCKLSFGLNLFY